MKSYRRIPTSYAVWEAIEASHPDLTLFSTYSSPETGIMETSYCFGGQDIPIIEAQTKWDTDPENPFIRENQRHLYWLCLPIPESET